MINWIYIFKYSTIFLHFIWKYYKCKYFFTK